MIPQPSRRWRVREAQQGGHVHVRVFEALSETPQPTYALLGTLVFDAATWPNMRAILEAGGVEVLDDLEVTTWPSR